MPQQTATRKEGRTKKATGDRLSDELGNNRQFSHFAVSNDDEVLLGDLQMDPANFIREISPSPSTKTFLDVARFE